MEEKEVELIDYLLVLWKYKALIIFGTALGILIGIMYFKELTPTYESTVVLLQKGKDVKVRSETIIDTEVQPITITIISELINSRRIGEKVLEKYRSEGTDEDWLRNIKKTGFGRDIRILLREQFLKDQEKVMEFDETGSLSQEVLNFLKEREKSLTNNKLKAHNIGEMVEVKTMDSNLIEIKVEDIDPVRAIRLNYNLSEVLTEEIKNTFSEDFLQRADFINKQRKAKREELIQQQNNTILLSAEYELSLNEKKLNKLQEEYVKKLGQGMLVEENLRSMKSSLVNWLEKFLYELNNLVEEKNNQFNLEIRKLLRKLDSFFQKNIFSHLDDLKLQEKKIGQNVAIIEPSRELYFYKMPYPLTPDKKSFEIAEKQDELIKSERIEVLYLTEKIRQSEVEIDIKNFEHFKITYQPFSMELRKYLASEHFDREDAINLLGKFDFEQFDALFGRYRDLGEEHERLRSTLNSVERLETLNTEFRDKIDEILKQKNELFVVEKLDEENSNLKKLYRIIRALNPVLAKFDVGITLNPSDFDQKEELAVDVKDVLNEETRINLPRAPSSISEVLNIKTRLLNTIQSFLRKSEDLKFLLHDLKVLKEKLPEMENEMNENKLKLNQVNRTIDTLKNTSSTLEKKYQEIQIQMGTIIEPIKVITEPTFSTTPTKPKSLKKIVGIYGLAGLFFFTFVSFFVNYIREYRRNQSKKPPLEMVG